MNYISDCSIRYNITYISNQARLNYMHKSYLNLKENIMNFQMYPREGVMLTKCCWGITRPIIHK